MRRLTLFLLMTATVLAGCIAAPVATRQFTLNADHASEAMEELSLLSGIQMYLIENQHDLEQMLANIHLSIPKIVTEATEQDRKSIECLAKNIYWEASNEPLRGKKAVAQVTINRTEDGRFADNICGVVYERDRVKVRGHMKTVCQFSWTCMKTKNKIPKHVEEWEDAKAIAAKFVLDGYQLSGLDDALFYHADYVRPRWARQMVRIEKIGAHIFYREKTKQTGIYLASNN